MMLLMSSGVGYWEKREAEASFVEPATYPHLPFGRAKTGLPHFGQYHRWPPHEAVGCFLTLHPALSPIHKLPCDDNSVKQRRTFFYDYEHGFQ